MKDKGKIVAAYHFYWGTPVGKHWAEIIPEGLCREMANRIYWEVENIIWLERIRLINELRK